MNILGISAFYHDSAACLVQDGRVVAAVQEERFSRLKHDPRFPRNAINYCLEEAKISVKDIDYIVFYDKPFLTFERLLLTYLTIAPKGLKSWLSASKGTYCSRNIMKRMQLLPSTHRLSVSLPF